MGGEFKGEGGVSPPHPIPLPQGERGFEKAMPPLSLIPEIPLQNTNYHMQPFENYSV